MPYTTFHLHGRTFEQKWMSVLKPTFCFIPLLFNMNDTNYFFPINYFCPNACFSEITKTFLDMV